MKKSILAILVVAALSACKPQDPAPLPPEATAPPAPAAAPAEPAAEPAADAAATDAAAAPVDAAAAADGAAPAADAPAAVAAVDGEAVFKKACVLCHGAGVGGAPKFGEAADWGPRAAQGDAVLFDHALKGFTGQKGMMPPKGGFANLSDDEVKAAVTYMVEHSK